MDNAKLFFIKGLAFCKTLFFATSRQNPVHKNGLTAVLILLTLPIVI